MSVNFDELLSTKGSDVKRPKPLPVGHYIATVKGFSFDKSKEKKTDFVKWDVEIQIACEDVDQTALAEFTESTGQQVAGKKIRLNHYVTPDSMWRLKDFLVHLGHDMDNTMLKEAIQLSPGRSFKVQITQVPSGKPNDDSLYNEVGATLPVDG